MRSTVRTGKRGFRVQPFAVLSSYPSRQAQVNSHHATHLRSMAFPCGCGACFGRVADNPAGSMRPRRDHSSRVCVRCCGTTSFYSVWWGPCQCHRKLDFDHPRATLPTCHGPRPTASCATGTLAAELDEASGKRRAGPDRNRVRPVGERWGSLRLLLCSGRYPEGLRQPNSSAARL